MCACSVMAEYFMTPWMIAYKAPPSMEFSKQEYWSGLQFPTPKDFLNLGTEPMTLVSLALVGGFFMIWLMSPKVNTTIILVTNYQAVF